MFALFDLLLPRLGPDPFRDLQVDEELRAKWPRIPPVAGQSYCILLTPRSGSSRLADILTRTGLLGLPMEYYNPRIVPDMGHGMNVGSFEAYVDMLPRKRHQGGVYGLRITYQQLRRCFGQEARFVAAHRDATFFWLIREDIVAQAVSVSRMLQTGLRHLEAPDPAKSHIADDRFRYRPGDIRRRIWQLHWMEMRTERMLRRFAITPHRLSYEQLQAETPRQTARHFADPLGIALPGDLDPGSPHARVSTGKSRDFAERFRRENPRFMRAMAARRAPLLAALPAPEPTG
jgi:LPS sulfotransferase NodH